MTDVVVPPTVDLLPDAPVRGQPGFSDATGTFLEALPGWGGSVDAAGQAAYQNALAAREAAADVAGQAAVAADPAGLLGKMSGSLTLGAGNKDIVLDAARPELLTATRQVVIVLISDKSIRMWGSISASPTPTPTTARVVVVSSGVFPSGGSGTYSGWEILDGSFFEPGATATEEWAGEADYVASTPKSRADANAKQTLSYASTITPDLKQGWHRGLSASASFTMGAPINCKPGDVLVVDILNTAGGIVVAVNAAWDRDGGILGVLEPSNGARNKFVGFIDEVDGSGVMTRGTYDVRRGLA